MLTDIMSIKFKKIISYHSRLVFKYYKKSVNFMIGGANFIYFCTSNILKCAKCVKMDSLAKHSYNLIKEDFKKRLKKEKQVLLSLF